MERDQITPHPEIGAGVEAWQKWVDKVLPYRSRPVDPSLPRELQLIAKMPDREMAAVAAELWFRQNAKFAPQYRPPVQQGFDGENWR